MAALLGGLLVAGLTMIGPVPAGSAAATVTGSGPRNAYRCTFNVNTSAFTGADGTASAMKANTRTLPLLS